MSTRQHICMLAAENAAIPGAKVGGIGDVVRDIPPALAEHNATVSVIIPAYGQFHLAEDAQLLQVIPVSFMGKTEDVAVYERFPQHESGICNYVLHSDLFSACGNGKIYCNDPDNEPFATDATKFALFSVAALRVLQSGVIGQIDVLHLHDWHAAFAAVLLKYDPEFNDLTGIRTVYSIHNLAMQGIRPFAGHPSSLESWYPTLKYDKTPLVDPRWDDCINPMAAAIRLCDLVHTVSPTYAREIQVPNDSARGFHGGEGLERDLQNAAKSARLIGIINGTQYEAASNLDMNWSSLINQIGERTKGWVNNTETARKVDKLANQRIMDWQDVPEPRHIVTSVGRLTDQKMALMLHKLDDGNTTLEHILDSLGTNGVFVLLASGSKELEQACQKVAEERENFLFLNRFDADIADWLYANGDLFLMPSSFEPCGISQMMAMRYGQPCLAHAVGGLRDTIKDNIDGYLFSGISQDNQAADLLERLQEILLQRTNNPNDYLKITVAAKNKRFTWQASAKSYIERLYS